MVDLRIREGDRVTAYAYGAEVDLRVRNIVDRIGLVGGNRLFIAPGTLASLVAATTDTEAVPPSAELQISNVGGVFDSEGGSAAIVEELKARIGERDGVTVRAIKADTLRDAKEQGAGLASVFRGIGSFSVIAGILLLVNLFVMLSEERKSELAMLRAVGLKRNHLLRAFALEGACYTVTAAVAGAALGVALGWVVVRLSFSIFPSDQDVRFIFAAQQSSLLTSALIGLAIGQLTVWLTSLRIARLNIVAALRDLADPSRKRRRGRVLIGSALFVIGAGPVGGFAIAQEQPHLALAGPAVALLATIPLLRRVLPAAMATLLAATATLIWGVAVEAMDSASIGVFVVQGIVLVSAAVLIVSTVGDRMPVRGTKGANRFAARHVRPGGLYDGVPVGVQTCRQQTDRHHGGPDERQF